MQLPGGIELFAKPFAIRPSAVNELSQQHNIGVKGLQYLRKLQWDWLGVDSMVNVPGRDENAVEHERNLPCIPTPRAASPTVTPSASSPG